MNSNIVVLKFGGSSVADNLKLNVVAKKIIDFYKENLKVVVVVSAQGKTTDGLIKEAKELANLPNDREMDVLLSTGEQVSMSKLAILLNRLGYEAVSLTGMQAGIKTNDLNQNAKIENINTTRIEEELAKGKIVIVAGFQGYNEKGDITTLGRGGSDTTAVALAAVLNAKHCYIFSDVDGVYTTDPNKITTAKKLETLSYEEMLEIANEGAKVLHNRCIEIGEKYNVAIVTKSTFNNKPGTILQNEVQSTNEVQNEIKNNLQIKTNQDEEEQNIEQNKLQNNKKDNQDKIEDARVKSIVKNDDIIYINMKYDTYSPEMFYKIYATLVKNQIGANHLQNNSTHYTDISFTCPASALNKFQNLLEKDFKSFDTTYTNISRIAIIGNGIRNDDTILEKVLNIIELNQLEIYHLEVNESKIAMLFTTKVSNTILEQLHKELVEE